MRSTRPLIVALLVSLAARFALADPPPQAAAAPAPRPLIFLDRGLGWGVQMGPGVDYSELEREYLRQSLLLAAREELGWQTADAWLGERPGDARGTTAVDIVCLPGNPPTVDVLTGVAPIQRRRANFPLPATAAQADGTEIVPYEQLSREKFPQLLRQITGLAPVKRSPWGAAELPDGAAEQIDQMTFCSEFAAVRAIHAQIAAHGESPAAVGGLIRGYANLGLLTEGLWNPSFRTYHARALLYAQRWLVREPNSRLALWHLAYAEAAAGLHARAIDDLARADKLPAAPAGGRASDPPAWLPLIRGYVTFDLELLKPANDHPSTPLARLLLFLGYQQAGSHDLAIRTGTAALKTMPECFRIHDDLARLGGVSLGHRTTVAAPGVFAMTLYRNVATIDGCPDKAMEIAVPRARQDEPLSADEAVAEQLDRQSLIAALREEETAAANRAARPAASAGAAAGSDKADTGPATSEPARLDGAEPGWGDLAAWIDDTTFSQVFRRTRFLAQSYGVDPAEYIESVAPLIKQHPYRCVIDSFRYDQTARVAALNQVRGLRLYGLDVRQRYVSDAFDSADWDQAMTIFQDLYEQCDDTANDFAVVVSCYSGANRVPAAERLLRVSPRNPLALAILIEERWDQYQGRAEQFADLAKQHPRLGRALATKYAQLKQYEKAESLWTLAARLEPSFESYNGLADLYRSQGNLEKFQKTWETYLQTTTDYGLDHARANDLVAWCYIRRGEWTKAEPFATRSAESGAQWALLTHGIVSERVGKFDQAEAAYRGIAARYGDESAATWFLFCRRTGHGNEQQAREVVQNRRRLLGSNPNPDQAVDLAMLDLVDGKEADALAAFQKHFAATRNPFAGLVAAMLADKLNKPDVRDQLLADVHDRGRSFIDPATGSPRQNLIDLASYLAGNLKRGDPHLNLATAEGVCKRGQGWQVQQAAYVLGEYLSRHGKPEEAQRFWLHALDEPQPGAMPFELAAYRLKESGVKPEDLESLRTKLGLSDRWVKQ